MSAKGCGPSGFGPVDVEGLKGPVVGATDVIYGRGGEFDLGLDLYHPAHLEQALPVVVFIHGGGWSGSDKSAYRDQAARVASHGYLCASVNYRKSFEGPFPAAVEDCKCAVRWLRARADECCADPDHIGALGHSAGAHLAAMLALTPGQMEGEGGWADQSSAIQCAACYSGPFDLTDPALSALVGTFVKPSGSEDARTACLRASPISYVAVGAPPFLLIHGEEDAGVSIEHSDRFAALLGAAQAPFEFIRVRHGDHGFQPVNAPATDPDGETIFARLVAFLDEHLKRGA